MPPKLYIIAGPNGAGKTTFASAFLPRYTHSVEFVNADIIAQRLSPVNPEAVAIRAGREMLQRINALAAERTDFSFETTLSGKSYVPLLRDLKNRGYEIHLFFLWLPDVEMAVTRVADRVLHGGHDIPEKVIRRRHAAGIVNLFNLYRPLIDRWSLFDNSKEEAYLIARESKDGLLIFDRELFEKCSQMAMKSKDEFLQETAGSTETLHALTALHIAKEEVIKQHQKSGLPIVIWRNGAVYLQSPDEAQKELEVSMQRSWEKFDRAMAKVRDVPPLPGDEM